MARLKKDHSNWSSSGLYLKYQHPKIEHTVRIKNKKKNTKKWCRGKVGVEHQLVRYFHYINGLRRRSNWIRTRCDKCRKEFFHANDSSLPLKLEIDEYDDRKYQIQVKINRGA